MPTLLITTDAGELVSHQLNADLVTIGSHPDNAVVIEDVSVSAHHATIAISDGKYVLRDLNSTDGTKINGNLITENEVKDNDVITFGQIGAAFRLTPQGTTDKDLVNEADAPVSKPLQSFVSMVANVSRPTFAESKRLAHLAVLKAKLTKTNNITLSACYYALGRKCYEVGCFATALTVEFKEIGDLKQIAQDQRHKADVADNATALERLKAAAKNSLGVITAEASALKFKKLFTHIGEKASQQEPAPEIAEELDAVNNVKSQIASLEAEYAAIAADHSAQEDLKTASTAIRTNATIAYKQGWNGTRRVLSHLQQRTPAFYAKIFSVSILVAFIGYFGCSFLYNRHAHQKLTDDDIFVGLHNPAFSITPRGPKVHNLQLGMHYIDFFKTVQAAYPSKMQIGYYLTMDRYFDVGALIGEPNNRIHPMGFLANKEDGRIGAGLYSRQGSNKEDYLGIASATFIAAGPTKSIIYFSLEKPLLRKLFPNDSLSFNEFCQMFVDKYNIPKLKGRSDGILKDATYISPDGWKVVIVGSNNGVFVIHFAVILRQGEKSISQSAE